MRYHDTKNRGKSVLGFCATLDTSLSQYYSNTAIQPHSGQEVAYSLNVLFLQALQKFHQFRGQLPEKIVVFRDGVSESQFDAVRNLEVRSILDACRSLPLGNGSYDPEIIYTIVVKKTSTKLFLPTSRSSLSNVSNPPPGTLVTDSIVPEAGDFYLISHFADQGISSPSLYRTAYASQYGAFPLEEVAKLAYQLCHMYYNWTGAIKVPAPCMMAHKIAYLVGQCVHGAVSEEVKRNSFYVS